MKIEAGTEIVRTEAPAPAREWRTRMYAGPSYMGGVSYSADVSWGGDLLCRLVYAGAHVEVAEAHAALAARALIWIASYEARPGKLLSR